MMSNGQPLKIKIKCGLSGQPFPYGNLLHDNKKFVIENVGKQFTAYRHNINFYYVAENSMLVHIYNAMEIKDECVEELK